MPATARATQSPASRHASEDKRSDEVFMSIIESLTSDLHLQLRKLVGVPEQKIWDIAQRRASALDFTPSALEELRQLRVVLESIESARLRARNAQALDAARQRAATVKHDLVANGELVSASDLGQALGISRQAVHKGAKVGRLFAVEAGREHYFPAFLADPQVRANGLEDVLATLSNESGWSKWLFFTTPSKILKNATPVDALRKRRQEAVLAAARAYIER